MKSVVERLRKLFRLSRDERVILAQACWLFLLADVALRVPTFKRLLGLHRRLSRRGRATPAPVRPFSLPRLVWLVEVAGRYAPVRATCLKKALVLSWLLAGRGLPTELGIGVARDEKGFRAHAWLEVEGQVIMGHEEVDQYEPLFQHVMGPASRTR